MGGLKKPPTKPTTMHSEIIDLKGDINSALLTIEYVAWLNKIPVTACMYGDRSIQVNYQFPAELIRVKEELTRNGFTY